MYIYIYHVILVVTSDSTLWPDLSCGKAHGREKKYTNNIQTTIAFGPQNHEKLKVLSPKNIGYNHQKLLRKRGFPWLIFIESADLSDPWPTDLFKAPSRSSTCPWKKELQVLMQIKHAKCLGHLGSKNVERRGPPQKTERFGVSFVDTDSTYTRVVGWDFCC